MFISVLIKMIGAPEFAFVSSQNADDVDLGNHILQTTVLQHPILNLLCFRI